MIVTHEEADKIAFTGSTDVGRKIREATAAQEKELTLELGGKSPYIVFDDADLDSAVEGLVDARADRWLNGWTDGWMHRRIDYRSACLMNPLID